MESPDLFFSTFTPAKEALSPIMTVSLNIMPIVGIVAIAAIIIYMLYRKSASVQREWNVTADTIGTISEQIRQRLTAMKASKREITVADLLLEEITVRMLNNGTNSVSVRIRKFFGEISLVIAADGEEYNPFASLSEWDTESEDYYRDMIFRSYESLLAYSRRNKRNIVTIRVHSTDSLAAWLTFIAMILGIGAGFLIKLLPTSAVTFIDTYILSILQTLFMNALLMLIAPVVFFSVTSSLSNLSGGKELGRIGGKTVSIFAVSSVVSIGIGILLALTMLGDAAAVQITNAAADTANEIGSRSLSVTDMIIGIIPKNLVSPIMNGDMVQVIFISILVGLAMSALGDKAGSLKQIFDEADALFIKLISIIIQCMPVIAFAAMAKLVIASDMQTITTIGKCILALLLSGVILTILNMIVIALIGRVSPLPYLRKGVSYLMTPFMTSSSTASVPMTLAMCRTKLGLSDKISSFVIPLGAVVNMNGTCVMTMIGFVMLAKMSGVECSIPMILQSSVLVFFLSIGSPGIPQSSLIVLSTLMAVFGIPIEILGVVLGIWNINDRITTVLNVNGDIMTSIVVSASENELDKDVYNAK